MSNVAPRTVVEPPQEWGRLAAGVRRLLEEHDAWRARAVAAEERAAELQRMLAEVASGGLDPQAMNETLEAIQKENRELRGRLEQARERMAALVGRLDFLAEEP